MAIIVLSHGIEKGGERRRQASRLGLCASPACVFLCYSKAPTVTEGYEINFTLIFKSHVIQCSLFKLVWFIFLS